MEHPSYRAVADKHKVAPITVKRILTADPEGVKIVSQKKEQNTIDILRYMEQKKEDVCLFIDKYLAALMDDTKIEAATVNQLSTALGTVIDKFTTERIVSKNSQTNLFTLIQESTSGGGDFYDIPEAKPAPIASHDLVEPEKVL